MTVFWDNWCRLCSSEVDDMGLFTSKKAVKNLCPIIKNHFSISLNDMISLKICWNCHKFVNDIQTFSEHVQKVDLMFLELTQNKEFHVKKGTTNIRKKYGIENDYYYFNKRRRQSIDTDSDDCTIKNPHNEIESGSKSNCKSTTLTDIKSTSQSNENDVPQDIKEEKEYEVSNADVVITEVKIPPVQSILRGLLESKLSGEIKFEKEKKKLKNNNTKVNKREEFKCEFCDKKFRQKFSYSFHLQVTHKFKKIKLFDKTFPCSYCCETFSTEEQIKLHENSHSLEEKKDLRPCPLCIKCFSLVCLKKHIETFHIGGEDSFMCDKCGKIFSSKNYLNQHVKTHFHETPFHCSQCPKKFQSLYKLRRHIRLHYSEANFSCSACGKKFKTVGNLKGHMLIHSDIKKYKCEFCGSEFKRTSAYKFHIIRHTGIRSFFCQFCDKSFVYSTGLTIHMKGVHPNELAKLKSAGKKISYKTLPIPSLKQLKERISLLSSEDKLEEIPKRKQSQ